MVSWLSLKKLFKRSKQPAGAHIFTDDDRRAAEIKRLQKKVQDEELEALKDRLEYLRTVRQKQIMEDQISTMEEELYGNDDDSDPEQIASALENPDALLMQLFTTVLSAPRVNNQATSTIVQPVKSSMTDEQLREIKKTIPEAYLKKAKKMSDEDLIEFARMYKPEILEQYDQDTIGRAIKILRE